MAYFPTSKAYEVMRIAFLCKQRYTSKDVISDRYGRLYEIPRQLSLLGHRVHAYCLNYHEPIRGEWVHEASPGFLKWHAHSLARFRILGVGAYPLRLLKQLHEFSPDLVIGASDIPNVAIAALVAKKLGVPCVIDLYDNFESFAQSRIPGFTRTLKRSVRDADLVLAVSDPLRQFVTTRYEPLGRVITVPNGVDTSLFKHGNPDLSRRHLGLPQGPMLIGTAGGLTRSKGISTLYDAWKLIKELDPEVRLVLAGPSDGNLHPPSDDRVHNLGIIGQDEVAHLFNALNVGVVTALDSDFGRYCFPQKAYEMLASSLPIVAADTGVMSTLLASWPELLYSPEDPEALADAIMRQLRHPKHPGGSIPNWADLVSGIEPELRRVACVGKAGTP